MDVFSPLEIISLVSVIIILFTSLVIGFSLVELPFKNYFKQLILGCIVASLLYRLGILVMDSASTLIFIYSLFILVSIIIIKSPVAQSLIAILLALTFNLAFIHLLADNLFTIALKVSNVSSDPLILIMFLIFLSLTNIFIAIVTFQKSPVLFPARWFNINILEEKQTALYRFHFIFIILILIAIDAFLYYTYTELTTLSVHFRLFLIAWTMIVCVLFLYFSKNIVLYNIERMQFSLDQTYQKDLHAFYNIIRSQRHDFNIHLTSIYGLIENHKYKEANVYIQDIVDETREINHLLPLYHPAIGSLLYTYKELAMQKNIQLKFQIEYDLKHMPCTVYEMNKIVGNLLENAIEAIDQGEVTVAIDKKYNQIMLSVANTIHPNAMDFEQMFTKGYTTKNDHEGIGLPAIQQMLIKYNGVIYPTIKGNQLMMTVSLPINQ